MQLSPVIALVMCWWVPFVLAEENWKCLDNSDAPLPKKYIHYMGQRSNIIVQTSDRTLHRLKTEIFKIFLEEMIGFEKVEIVMHDNEFQMRAIVNNLSPLELLNDEFIRKSMVDLEVWIPLAQDLPSVEDIMMVKELGDIGPPGRFGWFIPIEMDGPVSRYYNKWNKDIREVHWTFLTDETMMEVFDVDNRPMYIVEKNLKLDDSSYLCNGIECDKGIYTPHHCKGISCALLLTSTPSTMKFVIEHINQLKLYVKVAFLGKNLKRTIDELTRAYQNVENKSLLILHYTPSEVILRERNFISVIFPHCDYLNTTYSLGCKYEPCRIVTMAWKKVESLGLSQHIKKFKFTEEDYDYLLTLYEKSIDKSDLREIGCQWLRDRSRDWIIEHEKNVIYVGGIFPLHKSAYNGPGIVTGAVLAQNVINKDPNILKNYKLQLIIENGKCSTDSVMEIFIDYIGESYYNNLLGVLGPACSDTIEPLAGISKVYRTMLISYSAEGLSFSDRDKYPYFFKTIGESTDYQLAFLDLFKELGWKRVAALTEDGHKYTEYVSHMQETWGKNGISFIANTKFPRDSTGPQMARYLDDLKNRTARIIILDVSAAVARTVMCEAYHMQMTSSEGYVWFLPTWLNETWFDVDYYNEHKNESVNCTTSQMRQAVNGYFSMTHSFYSPNNTVIQGNMTDDEWMVAFNRTGRGAIKLSNYARYAYDAMWTYALALDKLTKIDPEAITDLHSDNTTHKLVKLIEETDFIGVSGRIKFQGGSSRFSSINLKQWQGNKSQIVGIFIPNVSDKPEISSGKLNLTHNALRWYTFDGQKPEDGVRINASKRET